jgi:CRISPR-associated endonuclease Csn1
MSGIKAFRIVWGVFNATQADSTGRHNVLRHRFLTQLLRGKSLSINEVCRQLRQIGGTTSVSSKPGPETNEVGHDGARPSNISDKIEAATRAAVTDKKGCVNEDSLRTLLADEFCCEEIKGRAPYSRPIMREATDFVFATDRHPSEEGGPLYRSDAIRAAQLQRAIDEQTNNHLVRHRLLILERLHRDILKEFAGDEPGRIARVTIEVNRDLRELSGKTAKQVAQDIGQRLANFKSVTTRLEKAFAGKNIRLTPGLIRKARIAEDLGWKCPYTGKDYDEFDLLHRKVDKDHIIPRSERASDSLDSLVITFAEVNRMKGKRTAARFVEDCAGQTVEGRPELSIKTLPNFLKDVASLETFKGHDDDKRRKKRRKEMLQLRDYVEKEFTPRDLTQTSQLVRLGAQMLERDYTGQENKPVITSLPGSVTGTVRKSWNLLGCLATANPLVINKDDLDEHGKPKIHNKTEIRGITHLHHALDACVLALTSLFFPRDGGVWELLVKRRLNAAEQAALRERLGHYVEFTQDGEPKLLNLPISLKEQIRLRLAERRVVQHVPKEMTGLRVEQNAWRVVSVDNGEALLRQSMRQPDGTRLAKECREKVSKLLGLQPGGDMGKLQRNKSALIIPDNFGLALDPEPVVIPFHKVQIRLRELCEKNGGKWPRVLRNGMTISVPRGKFVGIWRIFSLKNNASGLALDIGRPDVVRLQNKTEGHKINVLLASLLRDGLEISRNTLTGVPSKFP